MSGRRHDKRRARFGLAYHLGRPEHASRLYVARRDPDSVRRAFRVAILQLEPVFQRQADALRETARRMAAMRCPRCGSLHGQALECPQRVTVHAWGQRKPVAVHVEPEVGGITAGLSTAQLAHAELLRRVPR